jgi:hypothetical protein
MTDFGPGRSDIGLFLKKRTHVSISSCFFDRLVSSSTFIYIKHMNREDMAESLCQQLFTLRYASRIRVRNLEL